MRWWLVLFLALVFFLAAPELASAQDTPTPTATPQIIWTPLPPWGWTPTPSSTPTALPTYSPTPTPTFTPSAGTPTATPTFDIWSVNPDLPALMYCFTSDYAGAWDCSGMGDYLEVDLQGLSCSGAWDDNPDTSPYYRFGVIVSPIHTEVITATCQIYEEAVADPECGASCSSYNAAMVAEGDTYLYATGDTDLHVGESAGPFSMVWSTTTNPRRYLPSAVPEGNTDNYPFVKGRSNARGDATGHCVSTRARVACQIDKVQVDGVAYDPWKMVWPTPTPSGDWLSHGWMTSTWQTVGRTSGNFGWSEGDRICYTLVPGVDWTGDILWWDDVGLEWDAKSVCVQEFSYNVDFMGVDVDYAVMAFFGALGVFWLWRIVSTS